jgi:ATPase family protein associated with various cellular activities (AAA)/winged helix domain-containing protein
VSGAEGWAEANQRALQAALAEVRHVLERHAAADTAAGAPAAAAAESGAGCDAPSDALEPPAALDALTRAFGLSAFERRLLLLAAGPELDSGFAAAVAAAQGDPGRRRPTFGLALAALPEAHWSALSPEAPLRRWRMVEVRGDSLTGGELRIDERILHYLVGVQHLDERLVGWVEPLAAPAEASPSQQVLAERLAAAWSRAAGAGEPLPLLELTGAGAAAKRAVAAAACARLGLALRLLRAAGLPAGATELEGLARLWEREAALAASALYVEVEDGEDPARDSALGRFLDLLRGPVVVAARERRRPGMRPVLGFEVAPPDAREQLLLWREALGAAVANRLDGGLDAVVSQFRLEPAALATAAAEALAGSPSDPARLAAALWRACRRQARPALGGLAQRLEPRAGWEDIVLPGRQLAILREIAVHVRHRYTVHERWGFAAGSHRGLGVAALFAGTSGTGKTMAAEVLARELALDLYRIDLSAVVSKYIGETEKNLARVFDGAEAGGAILLFDEADALFGKRSEVKDSHDRYANIEVSYLLQRMESYRGLAILTTNRKSALDEAFLRRLRFVVEFPFPDAAAREEIWCRVFPAATPTQGLALAKLARLNVAGGNIRNIALAAAFLAARDGAAVTMGHVLEAARSEYAKIEKPLSEAEIRGWTP